jgi:hypothetical protein
MRQCTLTISKGTGFPDGVNILSISMPKDLAHHGMFARLGRLPAFCVVRGREPVSGSGSIYHSCAESCAGVDAFAAKEINRGHSLSPWRLYFDQSESTGAALDRRGRLHAHDRAGSVAG